MATKQMIDGATETRIKEYASTENDKTMKRKSKGQLIVRQKIKTNKMTWTTFLK